MALEILDSEYYVRRRLMKKLLTTPIFIDKMMPKPILIELNRNDTSIKKSLFKGLAAHGSLKQLASAFIVHNKISLPDNIVEDIQFLLETDQRPFNLNADKELLKQLINKADRYLRTKEQEKWSRLDNHYVAAIPSSILTTGILFLLFFILSILFNTVTTFSSPEQESSYNKSFGSVTGCLGAITFFLSAVWFAMRYDAFLESPADAGDLITEVKEKVLDKLQSLAIRKQSDASICLPILPETKRKIMHCTSELSGWHTPGKKIELAKDLKKHLEFSLTEVNIFEAPFTLFRKPERRQDVVVNMIEQIPARGVV